MPSTELIRLIDQREMDKVKKTDHMLNEEQTTTANMTTTVTTTSFSSRKQVSESNMQSLCALHSKFHLLFILCNQYSLSLLAISILIERERKKKADFLRY